MTAQSQFGFISIAGTSGPGNAETGLRDFQDGLAWKLEGWSEQFCAYLATCWVGIYSSTP